MDATYIQNTITQLKTNIFIDIRHKTLQKYTGNPVLDENQLFFLLVPFFNEEEWQQEQSEAAITVGIVYAALAAHDQIKEINASSKDQQLTVLAGDFYSGRYYEILASSGNVALIRNLSQGIVSRCEHQIKVYEKEERTVEQWFAAVQNIEAGLIAQFFKLYAFERYIMLVEKGLLLLRLEREWAAHQNGQGSLLNYNIEKSAILEGTTYEAVMQNKMVQLKSELSQALDQATFLKQSVKQAMHARVEANLVSTN